jgi:hypothetical protein
MVKLFGVGRSLQILAPSSLINRILSLAFKRRLV